MIILLLGAQGQLGWELGANLAPLGRVLSFGRQEADLSRLDELQKQVKQIKPDVIVNAAAYTQVDQAESAPGLAGLVNAEAPALLAYLAKEIGAWMVHYSTDYVFDGSKDGSYTEDDATSPLNIYGQSKLAGDQAIMASGCRHLIFRTSWVYSIHGRNFPKTILELASREETLTVVDDQYGSPTGTEFLASATALALNQVIGNDDSGKSGLYNLVAAGYTNWHQYAQYVVGLGLNLGWNLLVSPEKINPRSTVESGRAARRPANSRLDTAKFTRTFNLVPPPWQYYVDRLLRAWIKVDKPAPAHIIGRQ